jgi:ABC-type uncharacterized transport system permease subunit
VAVAVVVVVEAVVLVVVAVVVIALVLVVVAVVVVVVAVVVVVVCTILRVLTNNKFHFTSKPEMDKQVAGKINKLQRMPLCTSRTTVRKTNAFSNIVPFPPNY